MKIYGEGEAYSHPVLNLTLMIKLHSQVTLPIEKELFVIR